MIYISRLVEEIYMKFDALISLALHSLKCRSQNTNLTLTLYFNIWLEHVHYVRRHRDSLKKSQIRKVKLGNEPVDSDWIMIV